MSVPAYLQDKLAKAGGDVRRLAHELVGEGWHPKNVERLLGVVVLAGGTPDPHGAKPDEQRSPQPSSPAPRPGGVALVAAGAPPREPRKLPPRAEPPKDRPSRTRLLGPIRATYGERVDVDAYVELVDDPPPPPRRPARVLELVERPRMFPGPGERYDDCINVSECLGRAVSAQPTVRELHCPKFCKAREDRTFEQRLAENGGRPRGNVAS